MDIKFSVARFFLHFSPFHSWMLRRFSDGPSSTGITTRTQSKRHFISITRHKSKVVGYPANFSLLWFSHSDTVLSLLPLTLQSCKPRLKVYFGHKKIQFTAKTVSNNYPSWNWTRGLLKINLFNLNLFPQFSNVNFF